MHGYRRTVATTLVLACAAGFVDVVGFLTIERVYTANMTGNLILVAINLAHRRWSELPLRATPILAFLAGLLAASALLERASTRGHRRVMVPALVLEAALLVAVAVLGVEQVGAGVDPDARARIHLGLVAALAFAMGLQNGTFTRVGSLSVRTTHVTGTMLSFAEAVADYGYWLRDRRRAVGVARALRESRAQKAFRHSVFFASMLLVYLGGAAGAALLVEPWGRASLFAPAAVVALLAIADVARPLEFEAPEGGPTRRVGR